MSLVLAIDTAARHRAVAVCCRGDGELVAATVTGGADAVPQLLAGLRDLLCHPLEAVVSVVGPGSFTGVRGGMAAALGIAQARSLPLHGIGALDVVAHAAPSSAATVTVVSDAGRGSLYTANYVRTGDRLLATSEPSRLGLDEWRRELAENAETTVVTLDEGLAQADPADPDGDHAGDDVPTILLGRAEQALAACVPLALSHPPLALAGLAAQYVGGALALRKAGV